MWIYIVYPIFKITLNFLHNDCSLLGLLDHYPKDHTDFEDCLAARDRLGETLLEGLTIINQAVRKNNRFILCRKYNLNDPEQIKEFLICFSSL